MYDSGDKIIVKCLSQAATLASICRRLDIAGQPDSA